MVLAVNLGNTTISLGAFGEDRMIFSASIGTRKEATVHEYANSFLQLLSLYRTLPEQLSGAVLASVVPLLTNTVKGALELVLKKPVLLVGSGIKTGLNIKKHNVNLGTDLVCAAVAAMHDYPLPCLIISLGTATTFTAVDENGCFLGTSITAGVQTSLEALRQHAALLPEIELKPPASLIGTTTADSMKSGLFFGTASMVDGMCGRYRETLGESCTCLVTGQYASLILPYFGETYVYDETLLLRGLYLIYQKNSRD